MSLKVHHVAGLLCISSAQKVVERHFIERCGRGERGDVTTQTAVKAIGVDDHRHGIPPYVAFDAPLDLAVSRIGWFILRGNGVQIRRRD